MTKRHLLQKRTSRRKLIAGTTVGAAGLAFGVPAAVHRAKAALQVTEGMALVSSPRMPLFDGIGKSFSAR